MGFWEELYGSMAPVAIDDAKVGYALRNFCESIGVPFELVWDLVVDTEEGQPGWSILLDPTRCPDQFLPWLAQFVGAKPIIGEDPNSYRARIDAAWTWRRGTIAGLNQAALRVGCTRFLVLERYGGDAWAVRFLFRQSEFTQAKEDYIAHFLPAGIIWSHDWWEGVLYQDTKNAYPTYAATKAAKPTYKDRRGG